MLEDSFHQFEMNDCMLAAQNNELSFSNGFEHLCQRINEIMWVKIGAKFQTQNVASSTKLQYCVAINVTISAD